MAESHFTSKFRFMRNKNKSNDKAPDFNLVIDYTVEEAVKAAEYLKDQALKAQLDGTTVRIYSGPGKFKEVSGFSVWGSLWGDPSDESASGKIAPLKK